MGYIIEGPFKENNEKRKSIAIYIRGLAVLMGRIEEPLDDEELEFYTAFCAWAYENVFEYSGLPTNIIEDEFEADFAKMKKMMMKYGVPEKDLTDKSLKFHARKFHEGPEYKYDLNVIDDIKLEVLTSEYLKNMIDKGGPVDLKGFMEDAISDYESDDE